MRSTTCSAARTPTWPRSHNATSALSEYEGATRDLVAQGFLIPMFLGQLDAQTAATNWEHPAPVWREKLESLGWRVTRLQHLSDYFWAPAFVLVTEAA